MPKCIKSVLMTGLYQRLMENDTLLLYLGSFSLLFFILTLVVIPWLVLQIPADYFARPQRYSMAERMPHPVLRILFRILKNLFGVFFVLLGIALLVLPGQGLLTILLGIILVDFPGKFRLERRFISHRRVLHTVNWLREKGKREPIVLEP